MSEISFNLNGNLRNGTHRRFLFFFCFFFGGTRYSTGLPCIMSVLKLLSSHVILVYFVEQTVLKRLNSARFLLKPATSSVTIDSIYKNGCSTIRLNATPAYSQLMT